jgi:hypothetical protein
MIITDRFEKEHHISRGQRRLDSAPGHAAGCKCLDGGGEAFLGHRHDLHDAMDQQHPTGRQAHDEPGEIAGMGIEPRERRDDGPRLAGRRAA